jgi:hypothetical protein
MAKSDLAKFCAEYLKQHPEASRALDAIADDHQFATAMAEAGAKAGFSFTQQEVEELLPAPAELSDDQLTTIVGGTKKTDAAKDRAFRTTFLVIKMNDIIVTTDAPDLGSR